MKNTHSNFGSMKLATRQGARTMSLPDACVEVSSLEDVSRWVQHGLWVAMTQFEHDVDHLVCWERSQMYYQHCL